MTPETRIELEALLSALCDGQLSDEEHGPRLESLLNDYPECRRIYLEYMEVHASLVINPERTGKTPVPAATEPGAGAATPSSGLLHWGRATFRKPFSCSGPWPPRC